MVNRVVNRPRHMQEYESDVRPLISYTKIKMGKQSPEVEENLIYFLDFALFFSYFQ